MRVHYLNKLDTCLHYIMPVVLHHNMTFLVMCSYTCYLLSMCKFNFPRCEVALIVRLRSWFHWRFSVRVFVWFSERFLELNFMRKLNTTIIEHCKFHKENDANNTVCVFSSRLLEFQAAELVKARTCKGDRLNCTLEYLTVLHITNYTVIISSNNLIFVGLIIHWLYELN